VIRFNPHVYCRLSSRLIREGAAGYALNRRRWLAAVRERLIKFTSFFQKMEQKHIPEKLRPRGIFINFAGERDGRRMSGRDLKVLRDARRDR
jgi:hypothetical protein